MQGRRLWRVGLEVWRLLQVGALRVLACILLWFGLVEWAEAPVLKRRIRDERD